LTPSAPATESPDSLQHVDASAGAPPRAAPARAPAQPQLDATQERLDTAARGDRERWHEVDRIFAAALALPPGERPDLLRDACGDDDALRREVESLLAHDRDDSFLEGGTFATAARASVEGALEGLVGQRVGRFEVDGRLGSGGMGEVYRAHDPRLGRPVALKVIPPHLRDDPEHRRRLRQEALTASTLNHPHLVTVYEIVELEDRDVLVTELVDGVALRDRLRDGALPIGEALTLARQVARGLAAAHAVGVVHRDVKPENLMIRRDGLVKLLDFGIAKSLRGPVAGLLDGGGETQPGRILGTVAYMSPEQARGLAVDPRTDVWSLGVVLYEMLTGRTPFQGDTPTDTLAAILVHQPEPPSRLRAELPPEVDPILVRALAKDPDLRYPSAAELAADLERVDTWSTPDARTARSGRTSAGARSTSRAMFLRAGAAATLLGSLLAGWLLGRDSPPGIDSLAMMPLFDETGDARFEYLGDGITEDVIRSLARAEGLRVISHASVFRYHGTSISPRELGRELGVRGVLRGRLRQSDDRLLVELELVDARDDSHLWGARYEVGVEEVGSVHHRIAGDVLDRIDGRGRAERRERAAARGAVDPDAYRLYLQGNYFFKRAAPEDYHRSVELFRRATEVAPDYAPAWAGLARYYSFGAATGLVDPEQAWPRAEHAYRQGLAHDPELPELAPSMASLTLFGRRDWTLGEQQLRRAAEVNPETLNVLSGYLNLLGRFEESLAYRRRFLEVDPVSVRANRSFGHALYLARRYDEAVDQLRRTLELDRADAPSWELLGDALLELGRSDEAVTAWRQGLLVDGRLELAALLERTHTAAGVEAAIAAVAREKLAAMSARAAGGDYVPAYLVARQSLRAGDRGAALDWALRALDERNRFPLDLRVDPVFDELRRDPRLREALVRLGLPPLAS
jgi:eukaryotic-like serine/threonine-protein kinase